MLSLKVLPFLLLFSDVQSHEVWQPNFGAAIQNVEMATVKVKVGRAKWTCKFEIQHQDSQISLAQSKVFCSPKKSTKKKVTVRVYGSSGLNYTAIISPSSTLHDLVVDSLTSQEMMEVSAITELTEEQVHLPCGTPPLDSDSDKRGAAGANIRLWPGAVIPYVFTSSFTYTDRLTFAKAVEAIEANTCLKFKGRTSEKYYMRVERECACGGSCFGGGYTDGLGARAPRRLVIGAACISPSSASGVGLVIHEILHALGVIHTQNRPDRDTYIWIDWPRITASGQAQYKKCDACNVHATPYDCMSVMHYRDWAFSTGGATMLPRNSRCDLKTGTHKLTQTDIQLLNKMYSCNTGTAVNGQWGPWSAFSVCSAKCGYGKKQRYRLCNNPKPQNGGKDCEGHKREEENCIEKSCLNCAQVGKNTKQRTNDKKFTNVKSWGECSTKCALDSSCTYWTWHHENAGNYAFLCVIMGSYGSLVDDSSTVSGSKDCSGCPEKNVNLQGRTNNEVIAGVKSWVECSRKCSAKSSCTAWAWAHEGAGDFALNCGLMDGYTNKAADSNVISGSRQCPGVEECSGLEGSSSCCTEEAPCKEKGGDCDSDAQCEGDLVCGKDNCREFHPDAVENYDCCVQAQGLCNGGEGTADCCTSDKPCDLGGGDCDNDDECAGDLVCGYNNCKDFHTGAASKNDCCKDPKVDGGWGDWSGWSTCSKSRVRQCDNPTPANGGEGCSGQKEQIAPCS